MVRDLHRRRQRAVMAEYDIFRAFLADLEERRSRIVQQDWTFPEPPPEPPSMHATRIQWRRSERREEPAAITIDDLRAAMPAVMMEYITNPDIEKTRELLLMNIAAGGGKTHGGVTLAQEAAHNGMRVLWAAGRHAMFADLQRLPHFDPCFWYHFLPIHEQQDEFDLIPTTCRYARAQHKWSTLGYPSFQLCEQLCTIDGHILDCPYRRQRTREDPIIFAMHEHLSSGMALNDFDLVIVDELPLKAFVSHRIIPSSGIQIPGAERAVRELLEMLYLLTSDPKKTFSGPELFERIGPILGDIFAEIEVLGEWLPVVPTVAHPDQVDEKPYWYLQDLLNLAALEYEAWKQGWSRWVERIKVNRTGLHLFQRSAPWAYLPDRMIVLDATATPGMYQQIFNRPVRTFRPRIKRTGNIYQIAGRLNGSSRLLDEETPTAQAREALAITQQIAARYDGRIGVICNKALRPFFEREYGEGNVEHYHNLRGTNSLEDVECLFVIGNPAINLLDAINTTAALNIERITPFGEKNEQGYVRPPFYDADQEYAVTEEVRQAHGGKVPFRRVKGFWSDPQLQSVYEAFREAELVQAIHRARPNVHECDVWVLTSTPTSEPLDGIWDDPPIGPKGIYWKTWLQLEPWLEEQRKENRPIGSKELAGAAGVDRSWVSRQKWLQAIAEYMPDKWEVMLIPTGGRPSRGIAPLLE